MKLHGVQPLAAACAARFAAKNAPAGQRQITREVLGNALVALMHEWPFEQITVQDILDRAGVGRTTFYTTTQTSKTSS